MLSRRGFSGKRSNALLIDLHVMDSISAGDAVAHYASQGGACCIDELLATQRWSQERGVSSQHGWCNLTKDAARIFVFPGVMQTQVQNLIVTPTRWTGVLTKTLTPTLVVVVEGSQAEFSARVVYHMILSRITRATLDDHIRQRSAVVGRLRHEISDLDLYLDPRGVQDCLAHVLARDSLDNAPIAYRVVCPEDAEEALRAVSDNTKVVISGEVQVRRSQ